MQNGGCNSNASDKACKFMATYTGARFKYLAANVIDRASGKSLFDAYAIKEIEGVKIAFIGAVVKSTPTIVTPTGVAGLDFNDEADTINALVPELRAQGVRTMIVLIHEGGTATEPYSARNCATLAGPIVDIARRLDKAIDVVMSGHTHQGYQCRVDGRLVVQGDFYGHLLSKVELAIDRRTGAVSSSNADMIVVDTAKYPKDPAMTAIIDSARKITDAIANQPVARLAVAQISRDFSLAGETYLGDVIADAQLDATSAADKGGAVIAFMNSGGIRASLPPLPSTTNEVSFGDVFTVQPFGNTLVTLDLTGAQIRTLLEQQWLGQATPRILQVSAGFSYTIDNRQVAGSKIIAASIKINGVVVDPARIYRVTVNNFLAAGGDNFVVLKEGKNQKGGDLDVDALANYLKKKAAAGTPVGNPPRNRIAIIG